MNAKFYNKNGNINSYSFYCGYVQSKRKNGIERKLYYDGNYHVKKISGCK